METLKVIIKQRELSYTSDYPDGWKFSAGDPFKFPVMIGDNPCFIKRFEQKGPEDISGWELLGKLSGKYEKNLSRVYDIKNVEEDGKEVYYIFYEFLDGVTMDTAIKNKADINLSHLNDDLFNAIRALQKYQFWFADFTEKNIFCQKDGSFVLVDVDSTQRVSDLPDNDMYGSKDYWILVLKYYKEILKKDDLRLTDVNGISLNYLQIAFLVLRLKLFSLGKEKDYNSTKLFNELPFQLNEMAPELKEIFININKNGKNPIAEMDITSMEDIIERKIVKNENIKDVVIEPVTLPVINEFKTSSSEIKSGDSFILSWQVENANKLELYKNGAMFKALDINQKNITIKGFDDGTRQQSSYILIAYKDLAMAKSDPVIVNLKGDKPISPPPPPPPPPFKWKKIIYVLLGIAVIVVIYIVAHKSPPPPPPPTSTMKVQGMQPTAIHEHKDSIVTIYGTNFPDTTSQEFAELRVNMKVIQAKILADSNNTFKVVVPVSLLKLAIPGDPLKIPFEVISGTKTIYSNTLICELDKEIKVNDFLPKNLNGQPPVVFTGNNLSPSGKFAVKINGILCSVTYGNNLLIVKAPAGLPIQSSNIPVEVDTSGKIVFQGTGNTRVFKFGTLEYKANAKELDKVKAMTRIHH
jgi:hypothetical protein